MKAFVVLSKEFQTREQNEMKKDLQDHVTKSAAAWMSPSKVGRNLPAISLFEEDGGAGLQSMI